MTKRWLPLVVLSYSLVLLHAAGAAPVKKTQSTKPAKPAAKKAPASPNPMDPMSMHFHPPVTPAGGTVKKNPDVPQAKSLAETPDVILNSRVRASLIAARLTDAPDIIAETAHGVVTLSGTVPTGQERARAEQVARKVRGVKGVKNKLTVKMKK
jgi:hyperosmotically inducible protein